jgi:Protein of unknown function (DUF992)
MRWYLPIVVPACLCMGAGPDSPTIVEIGVLSCTPGHAIDVPQSTERPAAGEAREMVCAFRAPNGHEETYAGSIRAVGGIGALPEKTAMLWSVRAPLGTKPKPGLLQQDYAADMSAPRGQPAPLRGERNGEMTLHTMADKPEGSASKDKPPAPQFLVSEIELVLKASTS